LKKPDNRPWRPKYATFRNLGFHIARSLPTLDPVVYSQTSPDVPWKFPDPYRWIAIGYRHQNRLGTRSYTKGNGNLKVLDGSESWSGVTDFCKMSACCWRAHFSVSSSFRLSSPLPIFSCGWDSIQL
jgi:hypothetical protein